MASEVKKAVITAAGFGTRFLPVTKTMPKEMLPLVDKPVIQFVMEEAAASGIKNSLIITGRGKKAVEDYFDAHPELENFLRERGKEKYLQELNQLLEKINIHYVRQREQRGLGDAVLQAKSFVGTDAFALLLGDTFFQSRTPCTKQMVDAFKKYNAPIIAACVVPWESVSRWGIVEGKEIEKGVYEITNLVEKPKREEAPSNLCIAGRYVLTPEIFNALEQATAPAGKEIQLTDALRELLKKQPMYAVKFEGVRYDVGERIDYFKTFVETALQRPDLQKEAREFLKKMV